MFKLIVLLFIGSALADFNSFEEALENEISNYDFDANSQLDHKHFLNFKREHNKFYETVEEELKRFKIFRINLLKIRLLNKFDFGSAQYGVNQFADLNENEFTTQYTGLKFDRDQIEQTSEFMEPEFDREADLPKEMDWREKGAVTEVKNQGSCGSCWAFSAIGSIEGANKVVNNELVSLSEEELVDCDTQSNGCGGGFMTWAFDTVKRLGGLETEKDYPYKPQGECRFKKDLAKVQLTGYVNLTQNEDDIAKYVAQKGPVSVGLNANLMQFYMKGIAHPKWFLTKWLCNPKMLNHGVLIVGFGETETKSMFGKKTKAPYWIIKNSWSSKWGRQGYYYLYRGDNSCGVSEFASAPIVAPKKN